MKLFGDVTWLSLGQKKEVEVRLLRFLSNILIMGFSLFCGGVTQNTLH